MLSAEQVNQLKAKIKAEMLRRRGTGSLASYGTAAYDFTVTPIEGQTILTEHGQKTVDLLLKIAPHGDLTEVQQNAPIPNGFDTELLSYVDSLAAETDPTGYNPQASSSCNTSCTGLCTTACTSTCTSCTGTCAGSCSGCSGSCSGTCTSCSGCSGCSGCGSGCASGCYGCSSCSGTCSGCSGTCQGSCGSGCSSCVGKCTGCGGCGPCGGACTTNCNSACTGACTGAGRG